MEAAWLGQAASWLEWLAQDPISWQVVTLIVLLAAMSTRALLATPWPIMRVRLVGALLAVGCITALVPRASFGLLLAGVAWYRGAGVGRSHLLIDDVFGHFTFGCIALVLSGLARAVWPAAAPPSGTAGVIVFFGCGLVALALARLELLKRGRAGGGEESGAVGRHWMGLLAITTVGVLGAAILLAGAVSFQVLSDVTRLMGGAISLVLLAIVALMLPIVFLIEQLIYGIRWLLAALGVAPQPLPPTPPEPMNFEELQERVESGGIAPEIILAAQAMGLGLLIALAIAVLAVALFRYRAEREQQVDEERESVWSWKEAWAALIAGLRGLWRRLLRRGEMDAASAGGPEWAEATEPAARTVREIYRAFLAWSHQKGVSRRADQTPYEFLAVLGGGMPDTRSDAGAITEAYVPVRYASGPVANSAVEAARAAWARLKERDAPVDNGGGR